MRGNRVIEVDAVTKRFGGIVAVHELSLSVAKGELVGLLGPNGSGKTTLLNLMSGYLHPDRGSIRLDGREVSGRGLDKVARAGMIRMFQLTRVFSDMSVLENLFVAGFARGLTRVQCARRADELLCAMKLENHIHSLASELSGGQQKLLEFASCFMKPPHCALLDEPFAAIHPTMRETMIEFIRSTNAEGQTYIVVSHDMPIVVKLCPRAICLAGGRLLCDGSTDEVLNTPSVIDAYLGTHHP